ncbi:MAG: putative hydrolase, partial [Thermoleophilia bacterium]|nr:putative hydrolase [Thermoleophilia bacterium]
MTMRMSWVQGAGAEGRLGPLWARSVQPADDAPPRTIVLLHGIASAHAQFDARWDPLCAHGTVVIPDLLGFGRSLDRRRRTYTLADHLDAIDGLLDALGRPNDGLVFAGHSLGGALALCIAARHASRTEGVLTWGAPLHADEGSARRHIRRMGRLNALVGLDTRLAEATCRMVCTRPRIARPIYRRVRPALPIEVLDGALEHSWWSYRGAMRSIILDTPWLDAMDELRSARVPVQLCAGTRDASVDHDLMRRIAESSPSIRYAAMQDKDHDVPIAEPARCAAQLA